MIIKLKNADFSKNNIGTLSTWTVSLVLGNGATYNGLRYVEKDAALNATITIAEGYELIADRISIMMGSTNIEPVVSEDGMTITINIDSVKDNVVINVPTVKENVEVPEVPENTHTSRIIPLKAKPLAYTKGESKFNSLTSRATTYGNVLANDVLVPLNPDSTFTNGILLYEVAAKEKPMFMNGLDADVETYVRDLRTDYEVGEFVFESDTRFLAVMKNDLNASGTNFTNTCNFQLYGLKRNFVIGEPTPVYAYRGTYTKETSTFVYNNMRAFVILDMKAGDTIEVASDNFGMTVFKLQDNTTTYEETLVNNYEGKTWTADADQRIIALAWDTNDATNKYISDSVDLNNIFKVTFNS